MKRSHFIFRFAYLFVVLSSVCCLHRGRTHSFVLEIHAPKQADYEGTYTVTTSRKTHSEEFQGSDATGRTMKIEARGREFTFELANNSSEALDFELSVDGEPLGEKKLQSGYFWISTYGTDDSKR